MMHSIIKGRKYLFERIKQNDYPLLLESFNKIRDRKLPLDFFSRKYDTKWLQKEYIGVIIKNEEKNIVGHLGIQPCIVYYNNQKYIAGQISDAFLSVELRGENVFSKLIHELRTLSIQESLDFLFVFPSKQALKGFISDNWLEVSQRHIQKSEVKTLPINKLFNKFKLEKTYFFLMGIILTLIAKREVTFKNPNLEMNKGGILIDKEYLNHKKYSRSYLISKNGFKFLINFGDGLNIGNVEYFEVEKLDEFKRTANRIAFLLGCHQINFSYTDKAFFDTILPVKNIESSVPVYFYPLKTEIDFKNIVFHWSDFNSF